MHGILLEPKSSLNGEMNINTRIKILKSGVIPALAYAAETWALTKQKTSWFQKIERKMLRMILRIKMMDEIRNVEILRRVKSEGS